MWLDWEFYWDIISVNEISSVTVFSFYTEDLKKYFCISRFWESFLQNLSLWVHVICVFVFHVSDDNHLFSSFIHSAKADCERWSSWNSFSSSRTSFLIIMYGFHVLCSYSSHLIKSSNCADCAFYFMSLIKSTKYGPSSFSTIVDCSSSTCLLIRLFFNDCNKFVWNIECTFISDDNSSSYV